MYSRYPNARSLEYPEHTQLIPKKKVKSPAWKYYGLPAGENGQLVCESVAICTLCQHAVSTRGGSTSNLISHLKLYHPLEYAKIKPRSASMPSELIPASDVTDAHGETSCGPMAVSVVLEEMSPTKKQKILCDGQPLDSATEKACTQTLTKFLVTTLQPYSMVESESFVKMVQLLNPYYKLPGVDFFSETAVPELYNNVKENIKRLLALVECCNVSITTDCWTSVEDVPFIAVTAHFLDAEWQLKSVCLSCVYFAEEDHAADSIKEVLINIISDWNLDVAQLASCTTENEANILEAISLLEVQQISCFGHIINRSVNKAFRIGCLQEAISKLKKLLNTVARSERMTRELAKAQESTQMEVEEILGVCPIFWWETLDMCNEFLQNRLLLSKLLQNYPAKLPLMLEESEVSTVKDLIAATKVMDVIIKNLSGEDYLTASSVLPLLQKITKKVQIKDEDNALLNEIKTEIFSVMMECYYENEELMKILSICTFCDPRFRLNYVDNNPEIKEVILSCIEKMYATDINLVIESCANQSPDKKNGLAIVLEDDDDEILEKCVLPRSKAEREVDNYLSMPKVHLNESPFDWWKFHEDSFPTIKVLARKFLAMQGTNAPSQRVFDTGEDMINENRAALSPEYAEMQVFLALNKSLF